MLATNVAFDAHSSILGEQAAYMSLTHTAPGPPIDGNTPKCPALLWKSVLQMGEKEGIISIIMMIQTIKMPILMTMGVVVRAVVHHDRFLPGGWD